MDARNWGIMLPTFLRIRLEMSIVVVGVLGAVRMEKNKDHILLGSRMPLRQDVDLFKERT